MILDKEKVGSNGVTTKYHLIDTVSVRGNQLRCHLESYVGEDQIAAKKPANYYSFCFDVTDAELETNNKPIMQLVLEKIGALTEWNGVKPV